MKIDINLNSQELIQKHSENLLSTGNFSDITQIADMNETKAHKNILSLAFPENDLKNVEIIKIIGVSHSSVEHFLHFVYTGRMIGCSFGSLLSVCQLMKVIGCWELFQMNSDDFQIAEEDEVLNNHE